MATPARGSGRKPASAAKRNTVNHLVNTPNRQLRPKAVAAKKLITRGKIAPEVFERGVARGETRLKNQFPAKAKKFETIARKVKRRRAS